MQWLLREREEAIAAAGVYPRKPSYYFMDPFFITLAMELDYKVLTERVKRFFVTWGSCGIGPPINEVDYIFVPANVNGNHWILMVLSVKEWGVMVFDPMTNKAEHAKEEQCVVCDPFLLFSYINLKSRSFHLYFVDCVFRLDCWRGCFVILAPDLLCRRRTL